MAFLINSASKSSINLQMKDTNAEKVSRTYNGVYPFGDLSHAIGAPAGADNPTTASTVADLLDKAGRALASLSPSTYVDTSYSITQSMKEILAG